MADRTVSEWCLNLHQCEWKNFSPVWLSSVCGWVSVLGQKYKKYMGAHYCAPMRPRIPFLYHLTCLNCCTLLSALLCYSKLSETVILNHFIVFLLACQSFLKLYTCFLDPYMFECLLLWCSAAPCVTFRLTSSYGTCCAGVLLAAGADTVQVGIQQRHLCSIRW